MVGHLCIGDVPHTIESNLEVLVTHKRCFFLVDSSWGFGYVSHICRGPVMDT